MARDDMTWIIAPALFVMFLALIILTDRKMRLGKQAKRVWEWIAGISAGVTVLSIAALYIFF